MNVKGIEVRAIMWLDTAQWLRFAGQFTPGQLASLKDAAVQAMRITGSPLFSRGVLYHNMLIIEEDSDVVRSVEALLQ